MLTNTTDRALLSLTCGVTVMPGEAVDVDPATLPEWDAVRRAFDRGELRSVVSAAPYVPPMVERAEEPQESQGSLNEREFDTMSKPDLWREVKAAGLDGDVSYRSATVDDLRALLGG